MYKRLDKKCPNSKFILTIRSEKEWIKSCKYLFEERIDDFKINRDIIDKIHEEIYGTSEFKKIIFLERFKEHNREVRKYFSDRKEDLLVIDISEEKKWKKLCNFLDVDHPNVSFPHRHSSDPLSRWRRRVQRIGRKLGKPVAYIRNLFRRVVRVLEEE